ncbi:MAG: 3-hydroxyacyl-CoA dehydrogenase NAD-binding domain-containing protein [Burkholderiales bacterium]
MGSQNFFIRKAAVLGTGVMGLRIAAHLANADVPVVLFGRAGEGANPNERIRKTIDVLRKTDPGALATRDRSADIEAANYDQHLDRLKSCDLIIEAIAEDWDTKQALYQKIAPYIAKDAIVASNTSGLSVNRLAELIPAAARKNFCGMHIFNPPRYMHLIELIPSRHTDPAMLDALESWLVTRLGKGIVRAKDTQSFVANRIGLFSILAVMHHTEKFGLGFDDVDALTGKLIGHPATGTFRTADMIGLDTLSNVMDFQHETLPNDPWREYYKAPAWFAGLIAKGALGLKTKGGIYRRVGKAVQVLDLATQDYKPSAAKVSDEVTEIFHIKDPVERFAKLRASKDAHAQFLWATTRDIFHYCAYHLAEIANNARDVDFAMRWGWGWSVGPFEIWQAAGWKAVAEAMQQDISAGKAMVKTPLPAWVLQRDGVYQEHGAYSPAENILKGRSTLTVYKRQLFPDLILGEKHDHGETLQEDNSVRLWRMPDVDPRIAILSFKSKMHALGKGVVDGIYQAVARAEADFDGLVLWHHPPFGVGANLAELGELVKAGKWDEIDRVVAHFQGATKALRYAQVPTVAAVEGMAFGGGAEVAMHCAHRVLALESQIGLVEAGVGLIPAGGGCKELARRASDAAKGHPQNDPWEDVQKAFRNIIRGVTSRSALNARERGFALEGDTVLFNARELLYVAIKQARALSEAGYHPPRLPREIKVVGRPGHATLRMDLVNLREGGFMSAHDYVVSDAAATVLCGGDVDPGTLVDEDWLLALERQQFVALAKTELTQQRMAYMLETGKPLRN